MEDTFPTRREIDPRRMPRLIVAGLATFALGGGCGPYIGTTAASFLRKVREDPDPNIRYAAYEKLAAANCYDSPAQRAEAVKILVAKYRGGKEPVATRAVILHTLGELRDPGARDAVIRGVSDPEPSVRIQACRALGKVGRAQDATILAQVMTTDTLEDCRIAAIDALGELKSTDPRIGRVLAAGMRNEDPATRYAALRSLRSITGKDLGVDASAWEKLFPEGAETAVAATASAATDAAVVPSSRFGRSRRRVSTGVYPPKPARYHEADPDKTTDVSPPDPTRDASRSSYPVTNPNVAK